ncbi:SUKH-3 domain-containing protein [Lentzea sp. CA-135723]|uniref:SUKH-3 domain-containing protein n=1 Tax=Lentzea sp. CA-135723 TaxID=3239950 RepID=UPI003D936112
MNDLAAADPLLLDFMTGIGWFPGREVDLTADLEAWAAGGYAVPGAVQEFMAECGGLEFEYPRSAAVGGTYSCVVSGVDAAGGLFRAKVAEYEVRLGLELCPIGHAAGRHLTLLMARDGRTYGGKDHFLAKVADDGYRALQAIWLRKKLLNV